MQHITAPHNATYASHIYQSYVALVDRGINRNKLIETLKSKGIQAQIGTYASHVQPIYNSKDKCPVSFDIFNRAIALPFYYTLDEETIVEMAAELNKTLELIK
jgi:dTDP-4-amino-4,6-dideoxygalactose transaminase